MTINHTHTKIKTIKHFFDQSQQIQTQTNRKMKSKRKTQHFLPFFFQLVIFPQKSQNKQSANETKTKICKQQTQYSRKKKKQKKNTECNEQQKKNPSATKRFDHKTKKQRIIMILYCICSYGFLSKPNKDFKRSEK